MRYDLISRPQFRFLVSLLVDRYICYLTTWPIDTGGNSSVRSTHADPGNAPLCSNARRLLPTAGDSAVDRSRHELRNGSPRSCVGGRSPCSLVRAKIVCTVLLLLALVVFVNMSLTSGVFLVSDSRHVTRDSPVFHTSRILHTALPITIGRIAFDI